MRAAAIEQAAVIISEARLTRRVLHPLPTDCAPRDESEAYAVQDLANHRLSESGFGPVCGYKIGATTPVMQEYLAIPNPCAGAVFMRAVEHEHGRFQTSAFRLGVECEIAVRIGRELRPPFEHERLMAAVDACLAAIEVVEDRYANWHSLDTPTLIADNFFGAACVLGKPRTEADSRRLVEVRARMLINGHEVGAGTGVDVLGNPLDALAWLADRLAMRGRHLKRGDVVLLGSIVQTSWVTAGDEVVVENEPLGRVHATFK